MRVNQGERPHSGGAEKPPTKYERKYENESSNLCKIFKRQPK